MPVDEGGKHPFIVQQDPFGGVPFRGAMTQLVGFRAQDGGDFAQTGGAHFNFWHLLPSIRPVEGVQSFALPQGHQDRLGR